MRHREAVNETQAGFIVDIGYFVRLGDRNHWLRTKLVVCQTGRTG